MRGVVIRQAGKEDWDAATRVAWSTFLQIAPKVSDWEGVRNFHDGLTSTQLYIEFLEGKYPTFCAFRGRRIVGMLSLKGQNHISLFFVRRDYQGKGIGSLLLDECGRYCREHGVDEVTVNAASTGLPFYLARGFRALGGERFEGGLRFTPMIGKI